MPLDHTPEPGFCQCGCGERTNLITKNHTKNGCVVGEFRRFVKGHRRTGSTKTQYIVNRETGCWEWALSLESNGYGSTSVNGKTTAAHRVFYERAKGPIPNGHEIDHLCRNRRCVNPDHLEAVTAIINIRRGALTKLNENEVAEIRRLADFVSKAEIGKKFGVSRQHISKIVHNKRWR